MSGDVLTQVRQQTNLLFEATKLNCYQEVQEEVGRLMKSGTLYTGVQNNAI